MKKLNLAKNILVAAFGACIFIAALIIYIQQFYNGNDGWGQAIESNEDSVIMMVIGIILVIYGVILLVSKSDETKKNAWYLCMGSASAIMSCYMLGTFFKALSKHIAKPEDYSFSFTDKQTYLYMGIVAGVLLAYVIVKYFADKKSEKAA